MGLMYALFRKFSGLKKSLVGKGHATFAMREKAYQRVRAKRNAKSRTKTAGTKYLLKKNYYWKSLRKK